MKIKLVVVVLDFFAVMTSCKKDKLDGDKSILVGEWEWAYTEKIVDYCDPDYMYTDILTPITEGTTWQVKLIEKGKIEFYQENNLIISHRVVFESFGCTSCCSSTDYISFEIAMDNDHQNLFNGCVSSDSLRGGDFPYPDKDVFEPGVDCYLTTNYFVRK